VSILKPYSTLLVGIALGIFIVPKLAAKAGVSIPGSG
jgi:hypothetical protein